MRNITSLRAYCEDNGLSALLAEYSDDNPYPPDQIGFKSTIGSVHTDTLSMRVHLNEYAEAIAKPVVRIKTVPSGRNIRSLSDTGLTKIRRQHTR